VVKQMEENRVLQSFFIIVAVVAAALAALWLFKT
jgi:hypothetical protein